MLSLTIIVILLGNVLVVLLKRYSVIQQAVDVRVVNFQKIDRVIAFWSYKIDKKTEWHNPLLFQFLVGYFFGSGAHKPTLR